MWLDIACAINVSKKHKRIIRNQYIAKQPKCIINSIITEAIVYIVISYFNILYQVTGCLDKISFTNTVRFPDSSSS